MRTNIEIDDSLMEQAMKAGPFKTKKDAVEAGLKLLARQAAYREILKWRGKLKWEGDESVDWTRADSAAAEARGDQALAMSEPAAPYSPRRATPAGKTAAKGLSRRARR